MAQKPQRTQWDMMHPLFEAIDDADLTNTECSLIIGIYRYIDGNGMCYPSYTQLSKFTKLSRVTISKNIKSLAEKGWISYKQGSKKRQTANTYWLNLEKLGITSADILMTNKHKLSVVE